MADQEASLLVEGRSGCRLRLLDEGGRYLIRKHAKNPAYASRLLKQARKQIAFKTCLTDCDFRVPTVFTVSDHDQNGTAYFEMEFIHAEKYSDFLGRVSADGLSRFAASIVEYLELLVNRATKIKLKASTLLTKLESVTKATRPDLRTTIVFKDALRFLNSPPSNEILLGRCHGDLTLSNMLFQNRRVYLIDFLDAFIETPCQDVVKLRQDTMFHWSLMLEPELAIHQRNRVVQTLTYIDRQIETWMSRHPSVSQWYDYLQVFNLLRILPYVSIDSEIEFVLHALEKQLNYATDYSNGGSVHSLPGSETQMDADASMRAIYGRTSHTGSEP